MLYIILLVCFVAIIMAFLMIYVPLKEGYSKADAKAQASVAKELDEMFLFIPVDYLGYIKFGCLVGFGLVVFMLTFNMKQPGPYIAAGLAAAIGYFAPEIVVHRLKIKRRKDFGEQLVDGLVLLSNGLRAGFTLQQAVEMLVEESRPPISQEFALVLRQYRLGMDIDEALTNCVKRTQDEDLGLAVTAVMITRQVGGNLAEIFDRIVTMIRDRKTLEGKVNSLTAQGRLQALVVALIPYVLGLVIAKINPEMMRLMWTTIPGFLALGLVIILDTAGYFWVLKLSKIEY